MFPYLIAGAIGFVVAKLFEEDEAPKYDDGGSVLLAPNGKPSKLNHEQWHLVRTPAFKKWFGDWENDPENSSKIIDEETKEPLVVYHGTLNGGFTVFNMGKISSEEWDNIYGSSYRSGADPTSFLGSHFAKEKDVAEKFLNGIYAHNGDNPKIYECFLNLRNVQVIDENDLQKKIIEQNVFNQFELEREFEYSEEFWELENDEMIDKYNNNKKFREEVNGSVLGQYHFEALSFANALADEYIEKLIKHKIDGIEYLNRKEGGTSFIALYQNQIKLADGTNTTFDGNNPDIRYAGGGDLSNGYKLPKYLYHLTSEKIFENIKKEGGLNPEYSKQSKGEKGIYLTDDKSVAENYAGFFDAGEKLILLKISTDDMDMSKFTSDDYELQDFLNDGGWGNEDERIEEYSSWDEVPFELSLEWVNQIQYHKFIPIQNIEIIK